MLRCVRQLAAVSGRLSAAAASAGDEADVCGLENQNNELQERKMKEGAADLGDNSLWLCPYEPTTLFYIIHTSFDP